MYKIMILMLCVIGGAAVNDNERDTFLQLHNKARKPFGLRPVKWNTELAKFAQSVTDKCKFEHSGGPYGENLFMGYEGYHGVDDAVDAWVGEKKDYNCGNVVKRRNRGEPVVGHYTQVVWAETTQIGCAYTYCGVNSPRQMILACEYEPRGNYLGMHPFPPANCGKNETVEAPIETPAQNNNETSKFHAWVANWIARMRGRGQKNEL